jgi:hypothetical protein
MKRKKKDARSRITAIELKIHHKINDSDNLSKRM